MQIPVCFQNSGYNARVTPMHFLHRSLVLIFILLLGGSLSAAETDDSPVQSEAEIRQLIRQLDSTDLTKRDEAEKKLVALGPSILKFLPAVTAPTSAEVRQRLTRVRNRLERAKDRAFVEGTTVTLQGEFLLSQVLTELEKQTGNKIVDYRDQFGQEALDPLLKLDLEKIPFWQAVDQIEDQAGLTTYSFSDQQAVALVATEDPQALRLRNAVYVGPFRIEGAQFIADRDLREPRKHSLVLNLDVQWEPRLRPIAIVQAMEDVKATDDTGTAVDVAVEDAEFETPLTPGSAATELRVPLFPPSEKATQLNSLSGRLMVLLPASEESFRFSKLENAKRTEERRGGAQVVLDQVRRNNDLWEVRIQVHYDDPGGALESHRGWIYQNEAYLETAGGERHNPDGFEVTSQSEDTVGMAYLFDVDKISDATFVYTTPTLIIQMPLEYELKDLPLP